MNVSNVEKIKEVKPVESSLRKGNKIRGELKEFNLAKGEAVLVLKGGKELKAKIDVDVSNLVRGRAYSFEVLSYEGGELKLGISGELKVQGKPINPIEFFMKENNIAPKFKGILELMVKHELPLTKENINKLISFIELNNKSIETLEKSLENINSYVKDTVKSYGSKNEVDFKVEIKDTLSEFLKFSREDIVTFVENDIKFNKENFQSFNKVFKSESGLFNILKGLDSDINGNNLVNDKLSRLQDENLIFKEGTLELFKNEKLEKTNLSINFHINNKSGLGGEEILDNINYMKMLEEESEHELITKNIINNESSENDEITKDGLKLIEHDFNNTSDIKDSLNNDKLIKNEIENLVNELGKSNLEDLIKNSDGTLKKDGLEILEKTILKGASELPIKLNKVILEKEIFGLLGKDVSLSDSQFKDIKESIKSLKFLLRDNKSLFSNKVEIVNEIKNKEEEMQGVIKRLIKEVASNSNKSEAMVNLIKSNINDFKLFNNFSNEYYYLDVPININKDEYGVRLVIKDERGEGKELDKSNMKLVLTVKTINLGEIDALLKFSNKTLNVELKSIKESIDGLRKNLPKLEKSLELLGFIPYIFVSEKVYDKSDISTYREFFNNSSNSVLDKLI